MRHVPRRIHRLFFPFLRLSSPLQQHSSRGIITLGIASTPSTPLLTHHCHDCESSPLLTPLPSSSPRPPPNPRTISRVIQDTCRSSTHLTPSCLSPIQPAMPDYPNSPPLATTTNKPPSNHSEPNSWLKTSFQRTRPQRPNSWVMIDMTM